MTSAPGGSGAPGAPRIMTTTPSSATRMTAACAALEGSRIRWCVLRGDPTTLRGDLDLLIHPDDAVAARTILAGTGFARLRDRRGQPGRSWAAGPGAAGQWERIDFRTELDFGRHGLRLDRDHVLAGAIVVDGIRRPGEHDEFWTLLFHSVLDAEACGSDHTARLHELAERVFAAGNPQPPVRPPLSSAVLDRVVAHARIGAWADVTGLVLGLAAGARTGRRPDRRRATAWAAKRLGRLATILNRGDPSGFSVAVLGPDGVGKTTICREVGRTYLRPVVQVSVGRKLTSHPVWGRVAPPVRRAARFAALLETYGRAWAGRRRGRVVLWDRHPDDPAVRDARVRSRRWAGGLAPDPDLVLVLDAPADVVHRRKDERSVADIETLRRAYSGLVARTPAAEVIDASGDLASVLDAVLAAMWRWDPIRVDDVSGFHSPSREQRWAGD